MVSRWSSCSLSQAWTRSGCASACQSSTSVRVAAALGIASTGPWAVSARGGGVARAWRPPAASIARQRSAGVSASASVVPGRRTENVCSMRASSSVRPRLSKPRSSLSLLSKVTRGVSCAERSSRDSAAISCSNCVASSGPVLPLRDPVPPFSMGKPISHARPACQQPSEKTPRRGHQREGRPAISRVGNSCYFGRSLLRWASIRSVTCLRCGRWCFSLSHTSWNRSTVCRAVLSTGVSGRRALAAR